MILHIIPFENRRFYDWLCQMAEAARNFQKSRREQRSIESTIRKLESFEDYQLTDIGLARSDLTAVGLIIAAEKRALRQHETKRAHTLERNAL